MYRLPKVLGSSEALEKKTELIRGWAGCMRLSRICVWACPANFLAKILLVIRPVFGSVRFRVFVRRRGRRVPGRGATSAARQDKKIAGPVGFEGPCIPPQRSLSLWAISQTPRMPMGLDREECGFGRFMARRFRDCLGIARARAASCRTRPRGSVNRPVGHLFRGRRRSVRPRPAL